MRENIDLSLYSFGFNCVHISVSLFDFSFFSSIFCQQSAALLFYAMSLLCHFLPYLRSGREQNLIRDLIYFGIIFPIGTTVFSFFWGLTFLNPTFILSDAVRLPGWANHAMHTWILPAAIIEGICFYHSKPSSSQGRALTVSFLAAYCGFTLVMGLVFNKWPYPFLLKLTIPYRLLFAIIPMSCSLLFYTLGEKLNSLFWKPVKIQTSWKSCEKQSILIEFLYVHIQIHTNKQKTPTSKYTHTHNPKDFDTHTN